MTVFTYVDLHNPTKRQLERMKQLKIPYINGMSWVQAKYMITEAIKNKRKCKF